MEDLNLTELLSMKYPFWKIELIQWYTYVVGETPQAREKKGTEWRIEIHWITGQRKSVDLTEKEFKKVKELLKDEKFPKIKYTHKDRTIYEQFTFLLTFLEGEENGVSVYHLEEPYSSDVDENFFKNQYPPHNHFSPPELYMDIEFDLWALEFDTADLGGYDAERVTLYFKTEQDVLKFLKGGDNS